MTKEEALKAVDAAAWNAVTVARNETTQLGVFARESNNLKMWLSLERLEKALDAVYAAGVEYRKIKDQSTVSESYEQLVFEGILEEVQCRTTGNDKVYGLKLANTSGVFRTDSSVMATRAINLIGTPITIYYVYNEKEFWIKGFAAGA